MTMWDKNVEKANLDIFSNNVGILSKNTRDSLLYDSVDTYLHSLIEKYMYVQFTEM